jgi:hypothetical protein
MKIGTPAFLGISGAKQEKAAGNAGLRHAVLSGSAARRA